MHDLFNSPHMSYVFNLPQVPVTRHTYSIVQIKTCGPVLECKQEDRWWVESRKIIILQRYNVGAARVTGSGLSLVPQLQYGSSAAQWSLDLRNVNIDTGYFRKAATDLQKVSFWVPLLSPSLCQKPQVVSSGVSALDKGHRSLSIKLLNKGTLE